jgi:hypothetical protein
MRRWTLPLLLLLLLLPGCAEVWTRPGSTEAEGDAANAACARDAALAVPPVWERRLVSPGRWVQGEACRVVEGRRRCHPAGSFYQPPRHETVDLNRPIREHQRRLCLHAQGFTYGGLRPLRL